MDPAVSAATVQHATFLFGGAVVMTVGNAVVAILYALSTSLTDPITLLAVLSSLISAIAGVLAGLVAYRQLGAKPRSRRRRRTHHEP